MNDLQYTVNVIGFVRSELTSLEDAPRQGDEGAPSAWIDILPAYVEALRGIQAGDELLLFTWLHEAKRETLQVHPRNIASNPLTGVFATRSSHRPNPIGLHRVTVLAMKGAALHVAPLEAIHGTPIIDIKISLGAIDER